MGFESDSTYVPQARNFMIVNQLPSEDFLESYHRQLSPRMPGSETSALPLGDIPVTENSIQDTDRFVSTEN